AHGYETGKGVALDTEQAFHWYLQAAEQGLDKAQNNLGRLFENGVGVTPDIDVAIYWYEEAARNGNANARANLARLMNSLIEK
ncbi:MAG: tetratricopeptide repeat protein, partial [Alphaproteobacteria bacterium]